MNILGFSITRKRSQPVIVNTFKKRQTDWQAKSDQIHAQLRNEVQRGRSRASDAHHDRFADQVRRSLGGSQ